MPIIVGFRKIGQILSGYHYKLSLQMKSTLSEFSSEFSLGCASKYIYSHTFSVFYTLVNRKTGRFLTTTTLILLKSNKSLKQVSSSLIALKVGQGQGICLLHGNTKANAVGISSHQSL